MQLGTQNGKISKFGRTITACALGQASAYVVVTKVIGKHAPKIQSIRIQFEATFGKDGPLTGGIWEALSSLNPVKKAKPCHGAFLLPFDAVLHGLRNLRLSSDLRKPASLVMFANSQYKVVRFHQTYNLGIARISLEPLKVLKLLLHPLSVFSHNASKGHVYNCCPKRD